MTPPVTILYLQYAPPGVKVYGAEQSLVQLVRGLDHERFVAHAVVGSSYLQEALQLVGATVHIADLRHLRLSGPPGLLRFAKRFLRFWRIVSRVKPDIIHANNLWFNQYAGLAGRLARVPSVCHIRAQVSRYHFWKFGGFLSSAILATSPAAADAWRPLLRPRQQLRVLYNGVDTDRFRPDAMARQRTRARLQITDEQFVAAVVARLSPEKRQDVFVQALAGASREVEECVGLLVGDMPFAGHEAYVRRLHALVEGEAVRGRVRFTGFVEDMPSLYSAIDVLVLASDDSEGCPRAVIEAMAAGRPIVATDIAGVRELVRHGKTGFLVRPGDSEGMTQAIVRLALDPDRRRQMGKAGRDRVLERFSVERYVDGVQHVYEELLHDAVVRQNRRGLRRSHP